MRILMLALTSVAVLTVGCTWVDLSKEGSSVKLLSKAEAAKCKRIGTSSSKSLNKVLFVERNRDKLKTELVTLARNEAVKMGGNGIMPATEIIDGSQDFIVYSCP